MRILAGLCFLAMCGAAQSERLLPPDLEEAMSKIYPGWEVSGGGEGGIFLTHPGSIVRNGDIVDVWQLGVYSPSKTNLNGHTYQSDKSLSRYDCKNRTLQILSIFYYADSRAAGKLIDSFKNNNPKTNYIVPDSIGEMMMNAACEKPLSKKTTPIK